MVGAEEGGITKVARALLFSFLSAAAVACGSEGDGDPTASGDSDLVGGQRDTRWSASGFLASGPSMEKLDRSKPACGATLIAPRVAVTAAHCVVDDSATFAFGTGVTKGGPVVRVVERHFHPDFHPTSEGWIDLTHALRMHDVAYLVLEHDVAGVTPAALPTAAPESGCTLQAIGYRSSDRVSAPACVVFRITLGTDPIFEVHPDKNSAICVADGDEGSAVVQRGTDKATLVGIYVGSVTQGITDCWRGTQYMDGYESMYGYSDWLKAGIASVAGKH